jgi:DNA-binding SARP family transcriptional activator
MLGLNANRVVPTEQLVDAVWDTSPPATARAQIQICVSALRRVLQLTGDAMSIRTRAPGYLLEVADTELDTTQFATLVASARSHVDADRLSEAVATLRSALGLWRGPALAGMDSAPLRREAAQLEESRLAAVMQRIRLDLALGRHEEVVGELTTSIDEHPLHEPLYELLMLALYRSGRQGEALEVCRRARGTLVEELGIEPGPSMASLETRILNRDPELDITREQPGATPAAAAPPRGAEHAIVPRRLPASIADFTGRQSQLEEIMHMLGSADADNEFGTRIVAISGKGGVGKSTLALRAGHGLRASYPDGHLFGRLDGGSDGDHVRPVMARLLRALGMIGSTIPDDEEERGEHYRSRLANKRMLVVLDAARSEEEVLPLVPPGPGCALIVTSRAPLSGLPGAHLIDLDVFDPDLALEMLSRVVGRQRIETEQENARELVELCGGLPLAIRIAGARIASRPHWGVGVLVDRLRSNVHRLDELSYRGLELRENINLSYRSLSPPEQRLFRLFALINTPDSPAWTAAALLDTTPHEAFDVLENLVEAQLLDTVQYADASPRYRFHELIRTYALERLNEEERPEERAAAVARLAGAWMSRAEHAHRREYGGDYTVLHGSAPRWPGTHRIEELDPMDNQIEWLESERRSLVAAVELTADYGMDELCWDLALTSVALFEIKGHFDDWRTTAQRALAAAEGANNRRGRAAMLYSLGTMHFVHTRLEAAGRCYSSALELFEAEGDDHGSALVLRNAGIVDRMQNQSGQAREKFEMAVRKMRASGDLVGEAHVLQSFAKMWIDEGEAELAEPMLRTALAQVRRTGYLRGEAQVLNRFAELHLFTKQLELAHQALNRVLRIVRDIGDRIGEAHALYRLGVVRQTSGRLDNAETTLVHALSLAERVGERMVAGMAHHALGEIALARGQAEAGAEHIEAAVALFTRLGAALGHSKALLLRSDFHQSQGENALATRDLRMATDLLNEIDTAEAARLRAELGHGQRNVPCQ